MLKAWEYMQVEDRVRMVCDFFPTLEPEVAQQIMGEWASRTYPATWQGEQKALDDLMMMMRNATLSPEQLEADRQRLRGR